MAYAEVCRQYTVQIITPPWTGCLRSSALEPSRGFSGSDIYMPVLDHDIIKRDPVSAPLSLRVLSPCSPLPYLRRALRIC